MGNSYPIIKLDATGSTNDYLRTSLSAKNLEDYTVVIAKNQYAGRGQRGNSWVSEPGKNLTFSFLKKDLTLNPQNHFILNMAVSLALYDALSYIRVPDVAIKWPNDIMSGGFKICGILMENLISGDQIRHSIIGIGMNVNQTNFGNLEHVSSLRNRTEKEFDLFELLEVLMQHLQIRLAKLSNDSFIWDKKEYESRLYQKGQISNFMNPEGQKFKGTIMGVASTGQLVLQLEHGPLKHYDFKMLRLLL
ncbi:MAG: biotin--[acetyl-CoA-carboxylase] ligase [Bacteroidota bacterium]